MPVKWNSTYLMLDSVVLYSLAFCQLKLVDPKYKWYPSLEEWSRVEKIMRFLKPFHEMTKLFSGHRYPTSNLYFLYVWRIQMLLQEHMVSMDLAISGMAKDMKSKFDKYWECYSVVLTFAIIFYPRYKFESVEFFYKKLDVSTSYEKVNVLREQMWELFEEYLCVVPPRCEQSSTIGTISGCDVDMEFDSYRSQCVDARSQSQLDLYLGYDFEDEDEDEDENSLSTNIEDLVVRLGVHSR
ncbi:UNVERIFIED_CONTAM: Zinc finger BED domain-containing protein DAYSLEEPER [Sesamum angustifolium]|uniref:Zinc finger BED domain-containing protein DAYSLEEPER n=1 Tax=Sesamum angustifolium TaxID=2727405 RepID=A0AAW2QS81_9LAMI